MFRDADLYSRDTLKMCAYLETLVEHRTKIVRAKKPLVASSFLQGNPGPTPGYLILITAEILYNFAVNCFCKEGQLLLWYTLCMLLLWNLATVLKMYHKLLWQNLIYWNVNFCVWFFWRLCSLFIYPISVTIEIFHCRFDDYRKGASPEAEATCS